MQLGSVPCKNCEICRNIWITIRQLATPVIQAAIHRFCVIPFVLSAANMTTRQTPKRQAHQQSLGLLPNATNHLSHYIGAPLSFPPSPGLGDEAVCHHRCLIENTRIRLHKKRHWPPTKERRQVSVMLFREVSVTRSSFNPLLSLLCVWLLLISVAFYLRFIAHALVAQFQRKPPSQIETMCHLAKRLARNSMKLAKQLPP